MSNTGTASSFIESTCISRFGVHFSWQIFEWWYFKKYGTSFIEQVSLNHISPLLGGTETTNVETSTATNTSQQQQQPVTGKGHQTLSTRCHTSI